MIARLLAFLLSLAATPAAAQTLAIVNGRIVTMGPTGRNVIKAFQATGTTAGACGGDLL